MRSCRQSFALSALPGTETPPLLAEIGQKYSLSYEWCNQLSTLLCFWVLVSPMSKDNISDWHYYNEKFYFSQIFFGRSMLSVCFVTVILACRLSRELNQCWRLECLWLKCKVDDILPPPTFLQWLCWELKSPAPPSCRRTLERIGFFSCERL